MILSPKILRAIFSIWVSGYIAFHLISLTHIPLPWFDETYMADIAFSWAKEQRFTRNIALHDAPPTQELIYGPMYFLLVGTWFDIVGFSFFSYRLFVFLSGLLVWLLTCLAYYRYDNNLRRNLLFAVIFALNPLFNRCLHEGRMDLTALAFMLIAWNIVFLDRENLLRKPPFWISSIALSGAMLTTPRIGVLILPLVVLVAIKHKQNVLIWLLIPIICYATWVAYAFGGVGVWLNYYQSKLAYTKIETPSWYVPIHEIPVIIVACVALISCMLRNGLSGLPKNIFFTILFSIGLFYGLVHDAGVYSILILPYYYWLIGLCVKKMYSA